MIIRARPKYIKELNNIDDSLLLKDSPLKMYFGTGRAALKFYLSYLLKNGRKTIAMQSFNCRVVADAAIEAGCNLYLLDVKIADCSISCEDIKKLPVEVDILLLTHYQGIPNKDYLKISKYCKENNILLIEDLAHVYNAQKDDSVIGSLSEANIYSFAFDKPLSCQEGGLLELKQEDSILINAYNSLPNEDKDQAKIDLLIFDFLLKYSTKELYHNGINNIWFLRLLFKNKISDKHIFNLSKLLQNRYIKGVLGRVFNRSAGKSIELYKLDQEKKELIISQIKHYKYNDYNKVKYLLAICEELNVVPFESSSTIAWNRFSIIDENFKLSKLLKAYEFEVGNYNWPEPLHIIFKDNSMVSGVSEFKNSIFLAQHILNIPLWSDEILNIEI